MTRTTPTPETVTLHVPFRIVKRGGRREMQLPPGAAAERTRIDNTLVKALARAFRWKRMLESGGYVSISELADKEGIAFTYMARLLRLTLIAPAIIEVILSGRHPPTMTLAALMEGFPLPWREQHARWITGAVDDAASPWV
jgi:hypothetical protein